MALTRLIEILPIKGPLNAEIAIPGSKSMTNRALIIAAQSEVLTTIHGALWSDDTLAMVECLKSLGIHVDVSDDPDHPCNRTIKVKGTGGTIPVEAADLYVGNAGTTARFITAFCALGQGTYRISGDPRMHERPMGELFKILSEWGIQFQFEEKPDHLPVRMTVSAPLRVTPSVKVDISKSSQFASALELVRPRFGYRIETEGYDDDHYFQLTKSMMKKSGGDIRIEPDASSASYFWAAEALVGKGSRIQIKNWPEESLQIDARFPQLLKNKPLKISRRTDLGDSVMMAAVLASFWPRGVAITDAGRLREQETDRLAALEKELTRCGAKVKAHDSWLDISPVPVLRGAEIETYRDHRMAMAFSILGLKVAGMRIRNPECVTKTFPNFFEMLEFMARQSDCGPVVVDAKTREELFL